MKTVSSEYSFSSLPLMTEKILFPECFAPKNFDLIDHVQNNIIIY
jgi:hypothetical protein